MKKYIHILFSGLPRFSQENLRLQFEQLNLEKYKKQNTKIYCHTFFWPTNTHDDRERIISQKEPNEIHNFLKNTGLFDEVYDYSEKYYLSARKIFISIMKDLKECNIQFPEENKLRPENFKIKIENIISQYVAKEAVFSNLIHSFSEKDNNDLIIYTRTDICFDHNFEDSAFSGADIEDSILFPRSGWHYDGYPDTFYMFSLNSGLKMKNFCEFLVRKIKNGEQLRIEKIWRDFIEKNFSRINVGSFIVLFLRNGKYKHSGIDGVIDI
jgi:hypothetical protein